MSTQRAPLAAVPGLSRTAKVPPPPPRRVQPIPAAPAGDPGAAATPTETDPPETPVRAPRSSQAPRERARPTAASSTTTIMRNVTLSLPAPLVAQVRARARTDRVSQPDVLMDALGSTRDRLAELLSDAAAPPTSDGLFLRRPARATPADPMSTLSLRMLSPNVTTIDEMVAQHEAPSRSALCAAALRAYLATRDHDGPGPR